MNGVFLVQNKINTNKENKFVLVIIMCTFALPF